MIIPGLIMTVIGILQAFFGKQKANIFVSWEFQDAEPGELSILMRKTAGVACAIVGSFFLLWGLAL